MLHGKVSGKFDACQKKEIVAISFYLSNIKSGSKYSSSSLAVSRKKLSLLDPEAHMARAGRTQTEYND